jgi:hypothetical protein
LIYTTGTHNTGGSGDARTYDPAVSAGSAGSHSHTVATQAGHTHTIGAHNHKWLNYTGTGFTYSWASNGTTQVRLLGTSGNTTVGIMAEVTSANAKNSPDAWTENNSGGATLSGGSHNHGGATGSAGSHSHSISYASYSKAYIRVIVATKS